MMYYLTKENYEKIKKELEELKEVKLKEAREMVKRALEFGDISENSEYDAAISHKANIEERIRELENILENAVIINLKSKDSVILPGVKFEAVNLETKKKYVFTLVTYGEADPINFKISTESPLGKAFLRKRLGDVVETEVNGKIVKYKIAKILND
ncbi:MAG: transcription elongation factor GreA [Patescibacteria group bacterium]